MSETTFELFLLSRDQKIVRYDGMFENIERVRCSTFHGFEECYFKSCGRKNKRSKRQRALERSSG